MKIKRALISVSDKTGIVEFAKGLSEMGVEILSTGGTAKALREAGVQVIEVSDYTGFPEMMGGRLKTLHPKIHGGILHRRDDEGDVSDAALHNIGPIDLVVVNLYPFEETIAKPNCTFAEAIENIDIGGPTMLRAAAKNHKDVAVIVDPNNYGLILEMMRGKEDKKVWADIKRMLALKVFLHTNAYDGAIARYLANVEVGGRKIMEPNDMPNIDLTLDMKKAVQLAYAENRDQSPALLIPFENNSDPLGMKNFTVVCGDPSYISIADGHQVTTILRLIAETFRRFKGSVPYIVVVGKHGNPCGAAFDWNDPAVAILKALNGDAVAAMGGEMVVNFPIDDELGKLIYEVPGNQNIGRKYWGLDIILAPDFSSATIEIMGKKEKRRLLVNAALAIATLSPNDWAIQPVSGGILTQRAANFLLHPDMIEHWTGKMSDEDFETLIIAWAVCWKASSNTVALAKDRMLIGLGCGQQDRIFCTRLAIDKAIYAGHDINGSLFASDAHFPYAKSNLLSSNEMICIIESRDPNRSPEDPREFLKIVDLLRAEFAKIDKREGPELLIDAGCKGGVVPGDGNNLEEVKQVFAQAGMAVGFVNKIHRGFAKH